MSGGVLDALTDDERRAVISQSTRRSYRKGDTLFHEGDPGDSWHVIAKGRVAIRTSTPLGEIATLAVLGRGEFFGEQALLDRQALRTASVVALEPVETHALHRRDFDELRRTDPKVQGVLVIVLAAQVRRLTNQLLEALYMPAETRVIRRLHELAHTYRETGDPVEIAVRQEDLAFMAGTTRPTANRVLKQLEGDGIVELARGRMIVLDSARLLRRGI